MTYNFTISSNKYQKIIGEIFFNINNKDFKFIVNIYSPDCDDCCNNINAYYFHYEKINEYGAKLNYTEYVNCFEDIALNKKSRLFGLDINKEFKCNSNELKKLFMNLHNSIITKIKKYFNLSIDLNIGSSKYIKKCVVDDMKVWKNGNDNGKNYFSYSSGEYSSDDKYLFKTEEDANEFLNDNNNNEIEEETNYVDDNDYEGGHLNYKLYPKLKELFHKYNYDIKKISNINNDIEQTFKKLDDDLSKYSIEFRGDGMGIIIIDHSNYDNVDDMNNMVQDIQITSLKELLELNVFIPTWNKYRWGEEEYTEEEIVKQIWLKLL